MRVSIRMAYTADDTNDKQDCVAVAQDLLYSFGGNAKATGLTIVFAPVETWEQRDARRTAEYERRYNGSAAKL